MATRGMLPKFRPAILGGGRPATPRPVIRAVRPTAPLPPPSPPRRVASAVDYVENSPDPSTADSPTFDEPTKARIASRPDEGPDTFDDETRLRGDFEDVTTFRADDETMARGHAETKARGAANDDYECETQRTGNDGLASTRRQISPPVDTERTLDKVGQATHAEYEDRRSSPPTIKDPTLDGEDEAYAADEFSGERPTEPPGTYPSRQPFDPNEDSGARKRPFDAAPANQTALHPREPVPIRTTAPMPAPVMQPPMVQPQVAQIPPHALAPALMATQLAPPPGVHTPQGIAPIPQSPMPPPSFGYNPPPRMIPEGQISFSAPAVVHRPMPVAAPRPATTRVEGQGRSLKPGTPFSWLAWFVFGTAFGLFFAFFATGYFSRFTKEEAAPQASPAPTITAPAPTAAPPPAATTVAAAATPAPAATPTPAATAATTAPVAAPPVAAATPVARPRAHVHRAAPAPKAETNASSDDDGFGPAPRRAAKEKPADVGDLLNAGLAP